MERKFWLVEVSPDEIPFETKSFYTYDKTKDYIYELNNPENYVSIYNLKNLIF
ncbi:hypothetical protein J2R98_000156 [Alkalibacillus filiformis]|uniref:Uncharacterized protein n=1 Tax=Alkalibacillus filiformis TaxID=200990 RepID=A0ABU0DPX2_9BACI|nr:hypothetical protein [Alkalibacillus filiformis]